MKILFINGSGSESSINSYIHSAIDSLSANGHNARELVLRDMKYSPCKGCFNCWVKTPGTCVYKDDGDTICREFISSDMVVLSSPIFMGYPSALAKNALDRIIPLLHPHLEDFGGEVHHRMRYNKYPQLALLLEKMEVRICIMFLMWRLRLESILKNGSPDDDNPILTYIRKYAAGIDQEKTKLLEKIGMKKKDIYKMTYTKESINKIKMYIKQLCLDKL